MEKTAESRGLCELILASIAIVCCLADDVHKVFTDSPRY
jgi:hypothetical protein